MKTERQRFEEWLRSAWAPGDPEQEELLQREPGGEYINGMVDCAWQAWASRATEEAYVRYGIRPDPGSGCIFCDVEDHPAVQTAEGMMHLNDEGRGRMRCRLKAAMS